MNKIEKSISDFKLQLQNMEQKQVILSSSIDLLKDNINKLEFIERDKKIPHSNPMEGVMEVKQLLSATGTANTINHSVTTNQNVPFTYTNL